MDSSPTLLGEHIPSSGQFSTISEVMKTFRNAQFQSKPYHEQLLSISQNLYELIKAAPHESFLLSEVIDFIAQINQLNFLRHPYRLMQFEFWLNQLSEISYEENLEIRAKIVGKYLPRDEYQVFFPIGMGKTYEGTHFVSAHHSPDIDTMIASFWGWIDAFAARVGDALHIWSLPGGPPDSPVTQLFQRLLGKEVFSVTCRTSDRLTLAGMDMVTRKNMIQKSPDALVSSFSHSSSGNAVLLVDQNNYLGDWRADDVEEIQQVLIFFTSCLRWFENKLYYLLVSLFAEENIQQKDIPVLVNKIFTHLIEEAEPAKELNEKQNLELNQFLIHIIGVKKGIKGTFEELLNALKDLNLTDFYDFYHRFLALEQSDLFGSSGHIDENRTKIFKYLQTLFQEMPNGIQRVYNYCNRLDIVMQIKHLVFNKIPHTISLQTDVENIRAKIQDYDYLSVVIPDQTGNVFPVGVVWAKDIRKTFLGTVTFRDFCNLEEVHMASYLNVISVVDHHKSSLKTSSTPMVLIGDTQSCNVLVAEQTFHINNKYSLGNRTGTEIQEEIHTLYIDAPSPLNNRLLKRLLDRRIASQTKGSYYIHPQREFIEYFCFLHAIFDDTDLLTKVSARDVECVASLLNKMKSLVEKKEVEIIYLEDIPRDKSFAQKAAKRILQNTDTHSVYKKIYALKEEEIEASLHLCMKGQMTNLFADTKEQNGCCRVGQTKIFRSNYPSFANVASILQKYWIDTATQVNQQFPQIDLHLHMISTIPSADEVFCGKVDPPSHQDEIWFWVPDRQEAYDHLIRFLTAFQSTPVIVDNQLNLEIQGSQAAQLQLIFSNHFSQVPLVHTHENQEQTFAILRFRAGSINSRKAMISPYLPRLLT
ncbi:MULTISPECIES: hypothetical protein [Parachlamydia]|jgi:hypothetical protein|uniref:Uncharacterized protein n=2 Tax=Parachlamydia acanthamoebae TaxID=83552 RepID=F8KXU0_PARAV|nr:hypothetical protein [Parachlamydia acanthamoebae]EFB40446.1 hypothetical protein pah_c205o100 [Parachlamydia acanthamoebae str. Hall's coccus]CCB85670.1 putative uncharacterized protein [Parachlamydia acanthamoebae UV-7]